MLSRTPLESAWRVLVGRPLRASEVAREQITPLEGLPALSLDALTSVAYGPEAIIVVLDDPGLNDLRRIAGRVGAEILHQPLEISRQLRNFGTHKFTLSCRPMPGRRAGHLHPGRTTRVIVGVKEVEP